MVHILKFVGVSFGFSIAWFFILAIITVIRGEARTIPYIKCIPIGVLAAICYTMLKYSL